MILTRALGAAAFALVAVAATPAALAEDEDKLVELFLGVCVSSTPLYMEKLKAAAEVMAWQKLEGAAATLMAPNSPNAEFLGWIVNWKSSVFFVGASEGEEKGVGFKTCAVMARHAMSEATEQLLSQQMKLEFVLDQKEAGQRFQVWKSEFAGTPIELMLTSATDGEPIVTLAVLLY